MHERVHNKYYDHCLKPICKADSQYYWSLLFTSALFYLLDLSLQAIALSLHPYPLFLFPPSLPLLPRIFGFDTCPTYLTATSALSTNSRHRYCQPTARTNHVTLYKRSKYKINVTYDCYFRYNEN